MTSVGTPTGCTLALLTCGPQLEVALKAPGMTVPSVVRLAGASPRSTLLLAAVDLLVEDAGVLPADVERVVVSRGPGSFTGIRAGLATAQGLAAALGATTVAFDSLLVHAARAPSEGKAASVWAAQPGRRGELYVCRFDLAGSLPTAVGEVEIVPLVKVAERGPWIAADTLDLGGGRRVVAARTAAEALLRLDELGASPQPPRPLYVEGPPVDGGQR